MPESRSAHEVEILVELAREYCSRRAAYHSAKSEGRLNSDDELRAQKALARMDERLTLLKSNSELDRRRAQHRANVIPLPSSNRKAAR